MSDGAVTLSLFPGIGMLDAAFEAQGFCVVRGPDVLWGGDIRRFHPPAGKFDGIIGGPPCQIFSRLAYMVRHRGHEPKFGNLIPEFERCIREARPQWFAMENVPDAPVPIVEEYEVHSFCLNNRQLGEKQNRVRRWSFGYRGERRILAIETVVFENPEFAYAVLGSPSSLTRRACQSYRAFDTIRGLQGLPDDFDLPGFTVAAKRKAVANGVPMAMGRAIAVAVRKALNRTVGDK